MTDNLRLCISGAVRYADVAKLADAQVSGSCGRPCRFKSCHPHHLYGILHKIRQYPVYFLPFWIIILRFSRFLPRLVRVLVRTFFFLKGVESSENRGLCNRILAYRRPGVLFICYLGKSSQNRPLCPNLV